MRRIEIDPIKGDIVGYFAKYISKGIDGLPVGVDLEDGERQRDVIETAVRIEAWRSIHGLRQFQFFGDRPVTVWRHARRLGRPSHGAIELVRRAAETPDWSSYIEVQGGAPRTAADHHVRLHKISLDTPGLYGDAVGERIVGIESAELIEITCEREWRINWSLDDQEANAAFSFSEFCQ